MTRPHFPDYDRYVNATGDEIWEFYEACHQGDETRVREQLARNPRLVLSSIHYYTPLFFALRENHLSIARHLLSLGADPLLDGVHFLMLIQLLAERGQTEALSLLPSIPKRDNPLTPLIHNRDLAAIKRILDEQPDLIDATDLRGNLPIHWAVMTRNLPLIDLLLANGANIDAERVDGAKPIYLTNGDYHYRGWRDIPTGTIRPHLVLIGYLLAKGAYYDIWTAARLGDLEQLKAELARDPGLLNQLPKYSGFYNSAPLRNAVRHGHYDVVEYLLDHGADPSLPERVAPDGAILRDAIWAEQWEIARLLLDRGANPNSMVDSSGNCVWAARNGPIEIQQLLKEKGGEMGLEMACYESDLGYIETALNQNPKAMIYPHLPLENRPLIEMVLRFQPDALSKRQIEANLSIEQAEWLLARGISAKDPDWLGVTPLHRCAKSGDDALAELCRSHGASETARDDHYRETPAEWARRFRKT
jgi:ankyrin repeat protein